MKIKQPENIEIPDDDIFREDKLGREKEVINLAEIVMELKQSTVLSINSEWGTGKTNFVLLLNKYLRQKGHRTIYFNAWEHDFELDPFLLITNHILSSLELDDSNSKELKKLAVSLLKSITLSGVDVTSVAFATPPITSKIGNVFMKPLAERLFANINKQENQLVRFKELISDALPTDKQKIVVFIDELDRCRPTFALEVLERVKHLFNIDGVIFVLSTDLTQLGHAVSGAYGQNYDGRKYLDRFLDIEYELSSPDPTLYWKYCLELFDGQPKLKALNALAILSGYGVRFLEHLNLRDIKRYYSHVSLCFLSAKEKDNLLLILILARIKISNQNAYNKMRGGDASITEILDVLGLLNHYRKQINYNDDYEMVIICMVMILCLFIKSSSKEIEVFQSELKNPNSEKIKSYVNTCLKEIATENPEHLDFFISARIQRGDDPIHPSLILSERVILSAFELVELKSKIDFKHYVQVSSSLDVSTSEAIPISS